MTKVVVRREEEYAKLRRETKRGWGVKGKDFIFWKERKKEEMKKVQWELGWRGEREIKQTEVLTFLFCLFNLVVFVKMLSFWGIWVEGSDILNGRTQEEKEK